MTFSRIVPVFGIALIVLGSSGCSREIRLPTTSLSGKVTIDGKPATNGVVTAYQNGLKVMETSIEIDGTYVFSDPRSGEYQLTVTDTIIFSRGQEMALPARYAKPSESKLTATVTSDQANTQDLVLRTK